MKAISYKQYGSPEVLTLTEMSKPVPKENELLVRIHATAANSGDVRLRKADPWGVRLFFGLFKPRIPVLGSVFSGEVEAVGNKVTKYKAGDQIFGATGMSFGAYAEYKTLPENGVFSLKPDNIAHRQASTIPFGGTPALHFLKKANIKPGQKVLIYGASGAIGSAAVQLAKHYGAHVTGVCSTRNVGMVKMLGADEVIDYTTGGLSTIDIRYDVVFETVDKLSLTASLALLKPGGTLLLGSASTPDILRGMLVSLRGRYKIFSGLVRQDAGDIDFLRTLVERGAYKPVIDRIYKLEEMAEAHKYVELGH
jgi:NADPH:quinone reductase-like Zn-dependent oxidoreductase